VVGADRSHAVFAYVALATGRSAVPGAARLPGLDPARRYRVQVLDPAGLPAVLQRTAPGWWEDGLAGRLVLPGAALAAVGLQMPVLLPEDALLLELRAV
jgi:alpha-galactosidase